MAFVWLYIIPEALGASLDVQRRTAGLLVFGLYCIPTWSTTGTSIGKWLLGLQLATESSRPSLGQAVGRWLVLSLLSPLWITWWPVLFRKDRRGIHDLLAGTYPVLVREEGFLAHLRMAFERYPLRSVGIGCALLSSLLVLVTIIAASLALGVE